jgi:hypothetical protein
MPDQTDSQPQPPPAKRGEAAWKEARERIAQRNAQARKAGKQRLEAHHRQVEEGRRKERRDRGGGDAYTR